MFNSSSSNTVQYTVLSACPLYTNSFIPIVGVGKRGAHQLVRGDRPRQHSFGTTLKTIGSVPADSRH